jgi:hypothetical protein
MQDGGIRNHPALFDVHSDVRAGQVPGRAVIGRHSLSPAANLNCA